jgi:transposase
MRPESRDDWEALRPFVPVAKVPWRRRDRKGGRPQQDDRSCWQALLWRLAGQHPWRLMPKRFGSARTVQRRIALWHERGILDALWFRYLERLPESERKRWRGMVGPRLRKRRGLWHWEMLGKLWAMTAARE